MKFLILDTETTGIDPVKNDVWQFAAIIYIIAKPAADAPPQPMIKREVNLKLKPTNMNNISDVALAVGNVTREQLAEFPDARQQVCALEDLFSGYVSKFDIFDKFCMVAYNANFDKDFLYNLWKKVGFNYFHSWFHYYTIDLYAFFQSMFCLGAFNTQRQASSKNKFKVRLEDMAAYFNIPLPNAHDAKSDCQATFRLFTEVVYPLLNKCKEGILHNL